MEPPVWSKERAKCNDRKEWRFGASLEGRHRRKQNNRPRSQESGSNSDTSLHVLSTLYYNDNMELLFSFLIEKGYKPRKMREIRMETADTKISKFRWAVSWGNKTITFYKKGEALILLFLKTLLIVICACVCVCEPPYLYAHLFIYIVWFLWRPEEHIGSHAADVTSSYKHWM